MQTITQSVVESHTKLVYKYIKQDVEAENDHTAKGRVEQMGTPTEIYKNPKTPFVAQFIGESAVIADYDRLKGFHLYPGMQQGNHTAGICKGGQIWNRKEIPEPVCGRYRGTESRGHCIPSVCGG
ncbi:MAG: spermidine/putrescine ABC transporter ATP-binding protein [Roseburia intestinalis]